MAAPRKGCVGWFAVMRLLLPHNDLRRYGMSLKQLTEHAAAAMGIGKGHVYTQLQSWPSGAEESQRLRRNPTSDIAVELQWVWEERCGPHCSPPACPHPLLQALSPRACRLVCLRARRDPLAHRRLCRVAAWQVRGRESEQADGTCEAQLVLM